jgi:lambda family phage tail tape measure protein
MELTELKFAVNTEELTTAVKKLEALGVAISDYNKVNGDKARADRESAAAAKALAKEQKAQEQATKKAADAAAKAAAAQKKMADAAANSTDEMSPLEKLLERLNNQYGDLVSGFTKGEASILQQARNFGAAENELKPFIGVLEKIKELTKDPFDASVGAIRSVTAEFDRLTQRSNLTAQGISLTTKQLSEYSRLSAEVSGKVNQLGLDPTQGAGLTKYNTMLAESQAEYLKIAGSVNRVTEEEKQRNAVLREQEKLAASTLRAQQKALEENATAMNQAVAEFRRLEQAKAAAAQSTAEKITKANADAAASAQRLNQITAMVQQGISEKEATKRVGMASQGISAENINQIIAAEKNLAATRTTGTRSVTSYDAAARELAKAQKWVTTEEEKMVSVLATLNQQHDNSAAFNEKAARSVFNYEQALKKSGITGEQAAAKLAIYRKQQQEILSVEQKRQAEYLKRGLQPQIGDVVVSLAAGQNPLTVLLQQGDQVRGLIAQTGIQGELLRKTMQSAMADTLKSVVQTATAMGSLFAGAAVSAGKSITGLVTGPIAALITGFNEANAAGSSAFTSIGSAISRAFSAGNIAFLSALPILLTTAAAAFAVFGVASYQVMKQESELSVALALSGGALGLSKNAAVEYSMSLNDVGISTAKGIEVLVEMAKAGKLTADETRMVAKAAVDMEKYAGVAIKDTINAFAKMKEKPVEALAELAIKTGMVKTETLELIAQLTQQGKTAEAAGIATKALADVTETQATRIKEQLHPLEALYKRIGSGLASLWNSVGNTIRSTDAEQLSDAYKLLNAYLTTNTEGHQLAIEQQRILISQISSRIRLASETARVEQLQSEYAAQFLEKQKLINEQEQIRAGLDQKKLTRIQAMDKAEADALKRVKNLTSSEIARIRETAGMQWDKSRASGQTRSQNELNAALNTYADIQNRAIGVNSSFNEELNKLQFLYGKNKISAQQYAAEVQLLLSQQPYATRAKREEEDAVKALAKAQETYNDVLGISSGVSSDFNNKLEALQLVYAKTDMSAQSYAEAVLKLLEKQPYYLKTLADEKNALDLKNKLLGKSTNLGAEYYQTLELINKYAREGRFGADEVLQLKAALEATTPEAKRLAAVQAENAKILSGITSERASIQLSYTSDFKTADEKAEIKNLSDYRKKVAEADAEYQKQLSAATEETTYAEWMMYVDQANAKKTLAQEVFDREQYLLSEGYRRNQAYATAFETIFKGMGDAIVDFALTGKSSFDDMIRSMIVGLIKLELQMQITNMTRAAGGLSGILSSLGSMFGGNAVASAQGNVFNNGSIQPFAKGGMFTDGIVKAPTMFDMGLMGEAGPEAIMPLRRASDGSLGVASSGSSSSNVSVQVINNSSSQATTNETVDSKGNRRIEVVIGEMTAGEISRSGSASQKSIKATFGIQPQLIRR